MSNIIKLFTIGFTGKSARKFFELLEQNGVKRIIDTRINNTSQLSGFAKGTDLAFFAARIGGMGYDHRLEFAPTRELLEGYRHKKLTWDAYTLEYLRLLDERNIQALDATTLHEACLLCSEDAPTQCHRRLLAEYLQQRNPTIQIIHLQ